MVKNPDSYQNRYSYIPPSVQKSIDQEMNRTMPVNLRKYYNKETRHVPQSAEKAMLDHMQKNLPGHLKKYADPHLQQNVIWSGNGGSGSSSATSDKTDESRIAAFFAPPQTASKSFSNKEKDAAQPLAPASSPASQPDSQNPYDFIMNPGKPSRQPLNLFTGGSTVKKAAIASVGLVLLIIIISVFSSFLNGANNSQKDKLLAVARAESEIIRITSSTNTTKLSNADVENYAENVRLSTESTQQQIITALAARGTKVKIKDIASSNPADDAALEQGQENGRYDDAFKDLVNKLLAEYQQQLAAAYATGSSGEKQIIVSANDQIKLLLGKTSS